MSDSSAIPVTNSTDKTTANVAQDDARNAESAVSGKVPKSESPLIPLTLRSCYKRHHH